MLSYVDDNNLIDYSTIIPSFQHLFAGFYNGVSNYSHLDNLKEMHSIFYQHVERVDRID